MRYAIVIEKAEGNYSAYVPDLPGCVATGQTVEDWSRKSATRSDFTSTASKLTAYRFQDRPASRNMSRLDGSADLRKPTPSICSVIDQLDLIAFLR
jgi:hypothetical protein